MYLQALSLPARFWRVLSPTLVGAQVLLLPGLVYAVYRLIRQRRWPDLLPLVWWLAFLMAYALRLPVNYQHGRYSHPHHPPAHPLWRLGYGPAAAPPLAPTPGPHHQPRRAGGHGPAGPAVSGCRGALAYRDDVAFIQNEMVAVAHWLDEHTAAGDLLAVHDIGAVGYVTDRPLLDLAGLITPKVIPFMTDAEQLLDWMIDTRGCLCRVFCRFFSDLCPTGSRSQAGASILHRLRLDPGSRDTKTCAYTAYHLSRTALKSCIQTETMVY